MSEKNNDVMIHMIGHAHIDPTWLWRWTEGFEEARATFRSALDRMNETSAFKFTASSACFYQWVKNAEPKTFDRIRERVREGRWEVAGGMWIEPDCNVPCGESFVRQGLYSQRFFQREFGLRAKVGFNPDSFGHAGALPQILKKLGLDYYVYMRPSPAQEMDYPDGTTFWWESPDGSRVLTCNLPECYNGDPDTWEQIKRLPGFAFLNQGQTQILGFYGVGNHGGGPTKRSIAQIIEAQKTEDMPHACFSTLREYFKAFEETMEPGNIPVIKNELQHHARGCYSVHAGIKRLNRQVEHAIMSAERFATAAWLLDAQKYPHDQFEKAWLDLLYNQFHDILAGTSLESSYEDSRDQLGAARHRAEVITNQSVQSIARDIDTSAPGNTIVVINPLPWPVTQPVSVSPIVERTLTKPLRLVDGDEQEVALQKVRGERVGSGRYMFVADIPAMGYSIYHARSSEAGALTSPGLRSSRGGPRPVEASRTHLENEWWRIEFDPYSGHICRLYDRQKKIEVVEKGNVLVCLADNSDTWSHDVKEYRVEAGRFGQAQLRLVEEGDVLATVRIISRFGASEAIQDVTLYRDSDVIDCSFRVNWQEQYRMLKLAFETRIEEGVATYEGPYGSQTRPANGHEEPGQQWFDLTGAIEGDSYGLAVLNDGNYGFDVLDGAMRVTMLRSPAYAHHDPARFDASAGYAIMDQGWHEMRFRLVPHAGSWQDARVVKRAWELNVPLAAHVESAHPGPRAPRATLLGTEADNVLLSVVKQSEEGEDLIVRGYETAGRPAQTTLHIPHLAKSFDLKFTPHEIKTVRINVRTWELSDVNLLEE